METGNSFEQLFIDCYKQLMITAVNYLHNEDSAKDAVQEAALLAFKNYNNLHNKQYFKTWITRILLNTMNKLYRKQKNDADHTVELEQYLNVDECSLSFEHEDTMMLLKAMDTLNEASRRILILKYFSGYTVPEISKILKLPEGTIKSKLSRAIAKLQANIKEEAHYERENRRKTSSIG